MKRMPVIFIGEYRGQKGASTFQPQDEPGKTVNVQPVLKFEYVDSVGEPSLIEIKAGTFDKGTLLDWASLKAGDRVHIEGVQLVPEKGDTKSEFIILSFAGVVAPGAKLGIVDGKASPVRAAA